MVGGNGKRRIPRLGEKGLEKKPESTGEKGRRTGVQKARRHNKGGDDGTDPLGSRGVGRKRKKKKQSETSQRGGGKMLYQNGEKGTSGKKKDVTKKKKETTLNDAYGEREVG